VWRSYARPADVVAIPGLFDLVHRGRQISEAPGARRALRRRRRSTLGYRSPRFLNRTKPRLVRAEPSAPLRHNGGTDDTHRQVGTGRRDQHRARAPRHAGEEQPGIPGVDYQIGTLARYEIRDYLRATGNRNCIDCDRTNLPLQIGHFSWRATGSLNIQTGCGVVQRIGHRHCRVLQRS
jgi:hypothetical protein